MRAKDDLEKFRRDLLCIYRLHRPPDWFNPSFSEDKAFACAVFSKIAYLVIPEFEVQHHSLAKIIPCMTYQRLIAERLHLSSTELTGFLRSADINVGNDGVFVILTEKVVVVGLIMPNVIIVALRGTRMSAPTDLITDISAGRLEINFDGKTNVYFHTGFFQAITKCLKSITSEISSRVPGGDKRPVYVVGHSLGGAMAGVMHALGGASITKAYGYELTGGPVVRTHSSYSFGMPRYGDLRVIKNMPSPHHVYNERDPIPGLPCRWMGYEDVPDEHRAILGCSTLQNKNQERQGWSWWFSRKLKHHYMERYIRRVGIVAGVY